jgi:hypothetical protein
MKLLPTTSKEEVALLLNTKLERLKNILVEIASGKKPKERNIVKNII